MNSFVKRHVSSINIFIRNIRSIIVLFLIVLTLIVLLQASLYDGSILDPLSIVKNESISSLFESQIMISVTLVSLVFAIKLIYFDLLKKKIGFLASSLISKDSVFFYYYFFSASLIILSFIGLINLGNWPSNFSVAITYISIFYSLITFILLLASISRIIKKVNVTEVISSVISTLTIEELGLLFNRAPDKAAELSVLRESKIGLVEMAVEKSINDEDWISAVIILEKYTDKLLDINGNWLNEINVKYSIQFALFVYKGFVSKAISKKSTYLIESFLTTERKIYIAAQSKNIPNYLLSDLDDFNKLVIRQLFEYEMFDSIAKCTDFICSQVSREMALGSLYTHQLHSYFHYFLHEHIINKEYSQTTQQRFNYFKDYFWILTETLGMSISLGNTDLSRRISGSIDSLAFRILFKYPDINENITGELGLLLRSSWAYELEKGLGNDMCIVSYDMVSTFSSLYFKSYLENEPSFYRHTLSIDYALIRNFISKGKFSKYKIVNDLCSIGKICLKSYGGDIISSQLYHYNYRHITELKKKLESNISLYHWEYDHLKSHLKGFKNLVPQSQDRNALIETLHNSLISFVDTSVFNDKSFDL